MSAALSTTDTNSGTAGLQAHTDPFETMHNLLQAKDDTSRFVGLALLKSVLDNWQHTQNPERLQLLWEAVPPKFLDRLLRARRNEKINKEEAQNMVDLAAAVLHTFVILLPEASRQGKRIVGRMESLVKALLESPPETTQLILQTLLTLVSHPEGCLEMLRIRDLSPLIEISVQHALVLDILDFTWITAATSPLETDKVRRSIDATIPTLQNVFKGTDAVTFIRFMGMLLPRLAPEALPLDPEWLEAVVCILRNLVIRRPTLAGRSAYTQLASALLQAYPEKCAFLLFKEKAQGSEDAKPFSYFFINLLLIDLRSSFPTLLSQLNSKEYPAISRRLAAAFDVISSFVSFLVRSLDDESGFAVLNIPADVLLKFRKDIAETMSLTIAYLRDRWDASFAGAFGLHPSARAGTAATSEGTRLTLTWDSIRDDIRADLLILGGIRALAIWIREDENENLRNESAGIMDMLLELYKSSSLEKLDFRHPVLLAVEGILETDDGIASFLEHNGWDILVQDLDEVQQNLRKKTMFGDLATRNNGARGLQIVRVLLAVLDHPMTSFVPEQWLGVVTMTTSMEPNSATSWPMVLEFQISVLQLATALLSKAAYGTQKQYSASNAALLGLARQLDDVARQMDDEAEATDFVGLLKDVCLELKNLR